MLFLSCCMPEEKKQPTKPLKNNLKIVQQNIQTRIFQENGKQSIFTQQPRGFHYEENKWDKKLSEALGRIAGCRFCYASNKQLSLFHHRIQPNLSQGVTSATLKLHSEERQMNTFKAVLYAWPLNLFCRFFKELKHRIKQSAFSSGFFWMENRQRYSNSLPSFTT